MIVVDQIVDKILEVAATIAFRHIGYLYHCNKNIHDLEVETKGLEETLRRFNDEAVRASRNIEDIEPDAKEWQNEANEMVDEVAAFLENKVRSNTRFGNCLCPNPTWRYRLGKGSRQKTTRVKSLIEKGTTFLTVLSLSHPAPPPKPPLKNQDFDSRKGIFDGIMEAIHDPTIKMIGVHGLGGVGKTTMVKDIRNQAKRDKLFDDVVFAVVSQNLDKNIFQGKLAAQLGLNLDDYERAEKLLTRLQDGKKNLVILDDVWDPLDLEELGIPTTTDYGNKPGCCKVLITSRKNLFHMMTPKPSDQSAPGISIRAPKACPKVFLIPTLEKEEAWTLFARTVEISVNMDEEMLSTAKKVCGECAGLPVAILAVATALKRKEKYAWEDALTQLKRSNFNQIVDINPKLFSSLKLSYDLLRLDDERSCFLLCSLFPEDAEIPIDDLVRYSLGMRLLGSNMSTKLEDVRNRVLTLVKGLKASCLLLDDKDDNTVKMHDVIRDVAINIAKDEKKHLVKHNLKRWSEGGPYEGYSAISLMSEKFGEIPSELGCIELRTLVLRSEDRSLPDSFFNGMESNLEVLDLSGMAIESLPISLSKLVKLRMLFLPEGVRDVSLLGELRSLEILCAKGIYDLAPEIRQLTCLKLLDLGNFRRNLRVIPRNVLSNLTSMEELCIPNDYEEWQDEATNEKWSNASLVELNSLTRLTTLKVHIREGISSPNLLCFEKLERFRISIGGPFYDSDVSHARILKFSNIPLEDKFKVLMLKSEVLDLEKVNGLEEVLHHMDGSGLFNLKYLKVRECDGGEHLLGRLEQFLKTPQRRMSRSFCNLSRLTVEECTFEYLFDISVARRLEQLQELNVSNCSNMEVIVEKQGDDEEITFSLLEYVSLRGLPNLNSFCSCTRPDSTMGVSSSERAKPLFCEKVVVPALEDLSIEGLDNISDIWDKQFTPIINEGTGSFNQLRSLKVENCPRLVNVVPSNMVKRLRNLKILQLRDCDSLVHEIEDLTEVLPGLETLQLWDLRNLREMGLNEKEDSLCEIDVVYPNINRIWFSNCPNLESRFSSVIARNRALLEVLMVKNCFTSDSKLTVLVETSKERDGSNDEPFVFPKLRHMELSHLADLESFCNSSGHEESLFNQKVVFPRLDRLYIWRLGSVKGIWDRRPPANSFQQLSALELWHCQNLLYVASSEVLGSLQNLERLWISSCNLLEEVFKSRGSESEEGKVLEHESTTEEVDTKVVLPRLRGLYLIDLPYLKSFCAGSQLPSSANREIKNCPLLETHF